MANGFLKLLRRYSFCLLLSVLMFIGVYLSTYYAESYKIGSDMLTFDLSLLFVIYVIPIFSFIYGSLSYVKIKKVWVPQLIIYFVTFIS